MLASLIVAVLAIVRVSAVESDCVFTVDHCQIMGLPWSSLMPRLPAACDLSPVPATILEGFAASDVHPIA